MIPVASYVGCRNTRLVEGAMFGTRPLKVGWSRELVQCLQASNWRRHEDIIWWFVVKAGF